MSRKRIQIQTIDCRGGCGRRVTTVNRSIHGLDRLHAQYSGYCKECLPIDEKELHNKMFHEAAGKLAGEIQ